MASFKLFCPVPTTTTTTTVAPAGCVTQVHINVTEITDPYVTFNLCDGTPQSQGVTLGDNLISDCIQLDSLGGNIIFTVTDSGSPCGSPATTTTTTIAPTTTTTTAAPIIATFRVNNTSLTTDISVDVNINSSQVIASQNCPLNSIQTLTPTVNVTGDTSVLLEFNAVGFSVSSSSSLYIAPTTYTPTLTSPITFTGVDLTAGTSIELTIVEAL
jgi:hypothetical protein